MGLVSGEWSVVSGEKDLLYHSPSTAHHSPPTRKGMYIGYIIGSRNGAN
jgi:hypothetical protein